MTDNQHKNLRSYIEVLQEELCGIVDMYLKELSNRDKLENAPINQVASALGVIIEKFTKNIGQQEDNGMIEELIRGLKNNDSSNGD